MFTDKFGIVLVYYIRINGVWTFKRLNSAGRTHRYRESLNINRVNTIESDKNVTRLNARTLSVPVNEYLLNDSRNRYQLPALGFSD